MDFSKPLFVKAGIPACQTADDVRALLSGATAHCGTIRENAAVTIIGNDGVVGPLSGALYPVQATAEAWVPYRSLRN